MECGGMKDTGAARTKTPERKNYDRPAKRPSAVQILGGRQAGQVLHRPGVVVAGGCRSETAFPGVLSFLTFFKSNFYRNLKSLS